MVTDVLPNQEQQSITAQKQKRSGERHGNLIRCSEKRDGGKGIDCKAWLSKGSRSRGATCGALGHDDNNEGKEIRR